MIRGAMVIFTAAFSVIFLKRRLYIQHYAGLALVVLGISIVGLSSVLYSAKGVYGWVKQGTWLSMLP